MEKGEIIMSFYMLPPAVNMKEHQYAYWDGAFSEEEIQKIIEIGDKSIDKAEPYIYSENGESTLDSTARSCSINWLHHNDETNFLYSKLGWVAQQLNSKYFDFDIWGFCESLQYTIYDGTNNDHYTWHMDLGSTKSSPRKLSLILQLSDPNEYEGGDLEFFFHNESTKTIKRKGFIYVFPSYIMHRVLPVTSGIRKTLVVWLGGPNFK